MKKDGVKFLMQTSPIKVQNNEDGSIKVTFKNSNSAESETQDFEVILLAKGRLPNVENLGCENAGIEYDKSGIAVNNYL